MTYRQFSSVTISGAGVCRRAALALVALPLLCTGFVKAQAAADAKPGPDTLTFQNGDLLTGKVTSEAGGKVVFHSDMAGDITVEWSKIKELKTGQKFAVVTPNERLKVGKPAPDVPIGTVDASNEQVSVSGVGGEVKNIPTKEAAYMIPEGDFQNALLHQPTFFHGWAGGVTLGAALIQATQTSQSFNGAIALVRAIPKADWLDPKNKTTFDATAAYGLVTQPFIAGVQNASSAKSNILHGDIERDEYLTRRFYLLGDASADHNLGSGLRVQQDYGAGAGYTFIKTPQRLFDVKGDIHYEQQEFYPVPPASGLTLNLVGANIGEDYMQKLPRGLVFTESGLVQPAFNVPSAFTAQVIAGLLFPVYKQLGFSLGMQDNYINNPPSGYKNNTFQFTAGLTYTLK